MNSEIQNQPENDEYYEEKRTKNDTEKRNNVYSVRHVYDRSMFKPPALYKVINLTQQHQEVTILYPIKQNVMKSHDRKHQREAMEEEMRSLSENDV